CADRTGLGHLVDELRAGGVVAVLERLGEDQPERGATTWRRPWLARGRQHRLDPLAPLDGRHAGTEARVAHPAAFQRRGVAAVVRRETDCFQKAESERTGLRDP